MITAQASALPPLPSPLPQAFGLGEREYKSSLPPPRGFFGSLPPPRGFLGSLPSPRDAVGSLPPPLWLNSGGPASRTRKERIRATLLGRDVGHVRCPRVRRLALWFDLLDPLEVMARLLGREGFGGPEELRGAFDIPPGRLIATPLPEPTQRLDVRCSPPRETLEQALLLGLCTQHLYDPGRPVLWTRTSLRRGLELHDPAGFYA